MPIGQRTEEPQEVSAGETIRNDDETHAQVSQPVPIQNAPINPTEAMFDGVVTRHRSKRLSVEQPDA